MPEPTIAAEAVEAALRGASEALYNGAPIDPESLIGKSIVVVLAAALPHLAQHDEAERWKRAYYETEHAIEVIVGRALGWHREQPGDPGYSEEYESYATGDHTSETMVAALASALAQHVSPSGLINAMVREIDAEAVSYRAVTDHGKNAKALTVASGSDFADVIAQRIYRLLSSAPTVEQVRRETLLSAADSIDLSAYYPPPWLSELHNAEAAAEAWLRARAAEEADRG